MIVISGDAAPGLATRVPGSAPGSCCSPASLLRRCRRALIDMRPPRGSGAALRRPRFKIQPRAAPGCFYCCRCLPGSLVRVVGALQHLPHVQAGISRAQSCHALAPADDVVDRRRAEQSVPEPVEPFHGIPEHAARQAAEILEGGVNGAHEGVIESFLPPEYCLQPVALLVGDNRRLHPAVPPLELVEVLYVEALLIRRGHRKGYRSRFHLCCDSCPAKRLGPTNHRQPTWGKPIRLLL